MTANDPASVTQSDDQPQALIGYRTNEEWQALLAQSAALLAALDDIGDDDVKQNVFATLQTIDAVHREALHRLVRLFKEGVLDQVITDPAIHTLMGMYDLLPEKAPACQKVWDFLGDVDESSETKQPALAAMPDDPPHWSPAPIDHPPRDGEALVCRMEEGTVILLGAGGQHYAFDAACIHHGDAIAGGRLDGFSWICPGGPGCVYDVRNGQRLGGGVLACHPVKVDAAGRLLLGFGMPFEPKLPAF